MKRYIICYIEDNHLGVYRKEIYVESPNLQECFDTYYEMYPTLQGVWEIFKPLTDNLLSYYSHEGQDQIQQGRIDMDLGIKKMFAKEEV